MTELEFQEYIDQLFMDSIECIESIENQESTAQYLDTDLFGMPMTPMSSPTSTPITTPEQLNTVSPSPLSSPARTMSLETCGFQPDTMEFPPLSSNPHTPPNQTVSLSHSPRLETSNQLHRMNIQLQLLQLKSEDQRLSIEAARLEQQVRQLTMRIQSLNPRWNMGQVSNLSNMRWQSDYQLTVVNNRRLQLHASIRGLLDMRFHQRRLSVI